MEERKRRIKRTNSQLYVYGNTAHKLNEVPQREDRQGRKQKRNTLQKPLPNRMNLSYVLFLSIVTVAMFYIWSSYIHIQTEVDERLRNISSIEAQIESLKQTNDTEYARINSSIDLDEIRRIAIEELGMVYASKEQVKNYEDTENEYMKQYEELP